MGLQDYNSWEEETMLTTDKTERKERPIARGVLDYFGDAIAEVAHVSFVGNQQHNPGEPLHWSREKSTDHADCIARHLIDRGTMDDDGMRHSAKAAWRALAMLQLEIEAGRRQPNGVFVECEDKDGVPVYVEDVYRLPETEALNNYLVARDTKYNGDIAEKCHALGCSVEVAWQIANGSRMAVNPFVRPHFVYIAGPMRGYDSFNFPAFDAGRDRFLRNGWNVISPADIDRAAKDTDETTGKHTDVSTYVYRDFFALFFLAHPANDGTGAVAMLPGWEKSTGAVAEFFLARWLGLKILNAQTGSVLLTSQVNTSDLYASIRVFLNEQFKRSE